MSKEKSPSYQRYPRDYLSDENVQLMSMEEEGCYNRLMDYCWIEGSIPADPQLLARLCKGVTPPEIVLRCFKSGVLDGRLVHARLDIERQKQEEWRAKSALGGKHSAHKPKRAKAKVKQQGGSTTVEAGRLKGGSTLQSSSSVFSSQFSSSSSSSKDEAQATPSPLARSSGEPDPAPEVFTELPLAHNGDLYPVTRAFISQMAPLYPGLDIESEVLRAKAWLINNPTRRKTKVGIPKFLNGWFARQQNEHAPPETPGSRGSPSYRSGLHEQNTQAVQRFAARGQDEKE